jgi:hypothetical protein
VQLGGAAQHTLRLPALDATASGAGFSATRTHSGVLIVFEPYELNEQATGTLTLKTHAGLVHIALRGDGIDTIPHASPSRRHKPRTRVTHFRSTSTRPTTISYAPAHSKSAGRSSAASPGQPQPFAG